MPTATPQSHAPHARHTRRGRRRRAFTIIEVIVIITILGIIAAVVVPRLIGRIGQSRQGAAQASAASLANSVKLFMTDMDQLPQGDSLGFLIEAPTDVGGTWRGPYVDSEDALVDPWGNPYVIRVPGEKNFDFDIISYGRDGQPGGEGEDADVVAP